MSNKKQPPDEPTRGLLGDLESIRSLLDESEDEQARSAERAPDDDEADVPLLEDVVHGGVSVNETFLSGEGDFADTTGSSALNDEVFKALLSDEWRESARELLDQARAAIEQHQTEWTPKHTDELNHALKVRIDETVQTWLLEAVQSRIDDLRAELLRAVTEQLRVTIETQFNPTSTHEDPDGE